ncbi:hypothetical protein HII31_05631 [Pseudocercospora fuligena]|uniref:Ig-like domain-containing protein n=1 Tax=Pseudocercospora fuligena TaxID=685502 RepID=A0A8H6VNE4_9PEZI|nr:hypothetical protein HII31_05631 [Pseudocercospora fuligena]
MSRIHWLTPTLMVTSLLCGLAFAIGHHFFYSSLDQTGAPDPTDDYTIAGSRVAKQQFNTAVGTAFAFLVRACLFFAVSSAYLQAAIWHFNVGTKSPIRVSEVDVVMSALGNILKLGSRAWSRRPLLLVVAIIAWLLPIAAIVAPATLTIKAAFPPNQVVQMPKVGYTSFNLASEMTYVASAATGKDFLFNYNGPSNAVNRIVVATASQGSTIQMPAPAPNSTWEIEMQHPILQCQLLQGGVNRAVQDNIIDYVRATYDGVQPCMIGPGYLAWHPFNTTTDSRPQDLVPFLRNGANGSYYFNNSPFGRLSQEYYEGDQLTIFIAATGPLMAEGLCRYNEVPGNDSTGYDDPVTFDRFRDDSTFIRCDVHNSTQQLMFDVVNGTQSVSVKEQVVEELPILGIPGVRQYSAVDNCSLLEFWSDTLLAAAEPCFLNATLIRTLSYQSIMDSFVQLLGGMIHWNADAAYMNNRVYDTNTSVINTILAQSPELMFLEDSRPMKSAVYDTFQDIADIWNSTPYKGLFNTARVQAGEPLRPALENLFHNITLGLMISPALQYNKSSAYYPQPVEVSIRVTQNIYQYSRQKLWLAYGLAIGVSTLVVAFGCFMIFLNSASYTEDFSTMLRFSRGAELDVDIDQKDLGGEDPLPKYLANAHITFPNTGERAMEKIEDAQYAIVAVEAHDEEENTNAKSKSSDERSVSAIEGGVESPVSPISVASVQEERKTRHVQRARTM